MNLFNQSSPKPAQPSLFHPQPHNQQPQPQQPFTGGYPGQMGQIRLPTTPQPQTAVPQTEQQQVQAQKDPFADLASLF